MVDPQILYKGFLEAMLKLTCLDLVLESVLAVHQKLVQVETFLRDAKVNDFLQLVRVVKVKYLHGPVILNSDMILEYLHHTAEELSCLGICLLRVTCLTYWPQL